MTIKLYKEGQGTWARGSLAFLIGIAGLMAVMAVFDKLAGWEWAMQPLIPVPVIKVITWQLVISAITLVPFFVLGFWLYNHPRLSDFLIETEGELKNKVTWPSRKEAVSNSIVVVITCVIMGLWVFGADMLFRWMSNWLYNIQM